MTQVRQSAAAALLLLAVAASASAQSTATVTVAWNANQDPYTVGYRLYYGTSSGSYQWMLDVGNQTSTPVTLAVGTTYYFAVLGYNAGNYQGPPSDEISYTVPATPPPAPPTAQVTASVASPTSALVTWQTTHAVTATINNTPVALSGSATMALSGQTTFRLVATSASGQTATATATVTPPPPPTAQITATLQSSTSALVTWQTTNAATITINGAAVAASGSTTVAVSGQTTFTLVASDTYGRTATASATVTPAPTPAPTATITATLQSPTSALISWQTTNAATATINGTSAPLSGSTTVPVSGSTTTTFTLVARAADGRTATASASVTPPPPPTAQITATLQSATAALVTWQTTHAATATINGTAVALSGSTTVPISGQTTFTLSARDAYGRIATASATVTPTPTSPNPTAHITATLSDPTHALITWQTSNAVSATINGSNVALSGSSTVGVTSATTFSLIATASDGRTATASATVTPTSPGVPGAPRNMTSSVSGSRVTLSWQAPTSGGPTTDYLLYVGTSQGGTDVVNGLALGNRLTISGDLQRGRYYARTRAANSAGMSPNSNETAFRIGRRLRTPGGFSVTWEGTVATLSWAAPLADSPDDVPTSYVLEAGTQPGASDVAVINLGNVTSFRADVPPGVFYVRVRAVNALGDSDPTADIVLTAPGVPHAPSGLSESGSGASVELRWTAPAGGPPPTGYLIEAGSAPGLANLAVLSVGNVTEFVTNAPPGTYYVRVRAINARGSSQASNEIVVRR